MVLYHLFFFFFNDTATTEIYTLSLHDALPISIASEDSVSIGRGGARVQQGRFAAARVAARSARFLEGLAVFAGGSGDRKRTRLNSSHVRISYALFCFEKKNKNGRINCALSNVT